MLQYRTKRPRLDAPHDEQETSDCENEGEGGIKGQINHDEGKVGNHGDVEKMNDVNVSIDNAYFKSYSSIHIHEEMLADKVRTNTYRWAILKNYESMRGKIVMDVGAGTGILSVFCAQAGAKKVYAVEASDMAEQIKKVVSENDMDNIITVIHDKVENIKLPEKVDVIVSEWMGYMLLYESMLSSVLMARDRWLKPDGLMFPSTATLYMAPISDETIDERLSFWRDMSDIYKVGMKSMVPYAQTSIANSVSVKTVSMENIQAHSSQLCKLDLKTATKKEINDIQTDFLFSCYGYARLHGFVTWFTVDFPQDITLSTSPYQLETHWQQTVLYIDEPVQVTQDTKICGCLHITTNHLKHRFLDIKLSFSIDDELTVQKIYKMDDQIT